MRRIRRNISKNIKARALATGLVLAGAGACALPVTFALPAYAESVSGADIEAAKALVEERRAEVAKRQAEYDSALEAQQASRDVVVNAERALEDAKVRLEEAEKNYATGFAGFIKWVIETEKDEMKEYEAEWALYELDMPEYDYVLSDEVRESVNGYYGYPSELKDNMGDALSPSNITRMYYMADWLDAADSYFKEHGITEVYTSHGMMYMTMADSLLLTPSKLTVLTDNGYEHLYKDGDFSKVGSSSMISSDFSAWGNLKYYFKFLDTPLEVSTSGIPKLEHTTVFPEELYNLGVEGRDIIDYDYETDEYIYSDLMEIVPDSSVLGFSLGVDDNKNFMEWWVADASEYPGTYSLSEYADALREYYSLVDPEPVMLAVEEFDNDLSEAQRNLEGADALVADRLARLKDSEKEYEEAVALLEGLELIANIQADIVTPAVEETQVNVVTPAVEDTQVNVVTPETEDTQESAVIPAVEETSENVDIRADVIISPAEGSAESDAPVPQVVPAVEDSTGSVSEETEGSIQPVVSDAETFTVIDIEPVAYENNNADSAGSVISAVSEMRPADALVQGSANSVPAVNEKSSENVVAQDTVNTTLSVDDISKEDILAENTSNYASVGNAKEYTENIVTAGAEALVLNERTEERSAAPVVNADEQAKEAEKKNGLVAEVLSYIFNGGAIALILPAGLFRRKNGDEILV